MKTLTEIFSAAPGTISEAELQESAPSLVGQYRAFPPGNAGGKGFQQCRVLSATVAGQSIEITFARPSGDTFKVRPI